MLPNPMVSREPTKNNVAFSKMRLETDEIHKGRLYIHILWIINGYDIAVVAQILSLPLKMSIANKSRR